jgi:hypothetical protein
LSTPTPPRAQTPDNRQAGAGCDPIVVLDIQTGKVTKQWPLAEGWSGYVNFAMDSKRVLVEKYQPPNGGYDRNYVVLCDIETGKVIWTSENDIHQARFLPGDRRVLAKGAKDTWHTLDVASGKVLRSVTLDRAAFGAHQLSLDGSILVGVVGCNSAQRPNDTMAVQVWHLGRTAGLVKTWPDLTKPL